MQEYPLPSHVESRENYPLPSLLRTDFNIAPDFSLVVANIELFWASAIKFRNKEN